MMDETDPWRARLAELRGAFDRSFAAPGLPLGKASLELLAIRIGGEAYAVRASDVMAVEADRAITTVPSENAELLGIVSVRGAIIAVYSLLRLLGHAKADATRWLVFARGSPTAFAFSDFEGQLRVDHGAVSHAQVGPLNQRGEVVHVGDAARPLVDVAGLVRTLEERARLSQKKESR
jgi:hypothetical protein